MSGRKGRSGGWNRLSEAEHRLRGTYVACRHGEKPSPLAYTVAATAKVLPVAAEPPASRMAGLGAAGTALVAAVYGEYSGWDTKDLCVLHHAGELEDYLATADRVADFRRWLAALRTQQAA